MIANNNHDLSAGDLCVCDETRKVNSMGDIAARPIRAGQQPTHRVIRCFHSGNVGYGVCDIAPRVELERL